MSRILLVCPEPLGGGNPAGIGIRFIEIARALVAEGHSATVLSPDGGSLAGCEAAATTPESIRVESGRADVAVVQGHVANDYFASAAPIPTVVDLYDPFIVENLHYYAERGSEVFTHDHATLVRSLLHGDLFLCASEAQRMFYAGMLLAVGRVHPAIFESDPTLQSLLRIVPFGVNAPRDVPRRDLERPAVLFGGVYDWYDPLAAIEAVAAVRHRLPALTITFNTHPNADVTPQGKLADAIAHAERRRLDFVRFEPWVAYAERGAFFDRHTIALLTFPQSIETDLSMRTRVYDYLWGALPIVTSPAPGTDDILERYSAGVVVTDGDYASAIETILTNPARYDAMIEGTRAFTAEHQWSRTLAPLLDFCASPRIDATKEAFALPLRIAERPASILHRLRRRMGGRA